jgi:hypothetical protein
MSPRRLANHRSNQNPPAHSHGLLLLLSSLIVACADGNQQDTTRQPAEQTPALDEDAGIRPIADAMPAGREPSASSLPPAPMPRPAPKPKPSMPSRTYGAAPMGCVETCRDTGDEAGLRDCATEFAAFTSCQADNAFACSADGDVAPDRADMQCWTAREALDECVDAPNRPPPGDARPGTRRSDGGNFDGFWTGRTAQGQRIAFIIREGMIEDLFVYWMESSGPFGDEGSCAYRMIPDPAATLAGVENEAFEVPIVSASMLLQLANTDTPVLTGSFTSAVQAEGNLAGIRPLLITCGLSLSAVVSSLPMGTQWSASWRGAAGDGAECKRVCDAAEEVKCDPLAGAEEVGKPCVRDDDCGGGTCVSLEGLSSIEGCWSFDLDSFDCPVSTQSAESAGWSGGYCSPRCLEDEDCGEGGQRSGLCSVSAQADSLIVNEFSEAFLCAIECGEDGECPDGLTCVERMRCDMPSDSGYCVPCAED